MNRVINSVPVTIPSGVELTSQIMSTSKPIRLKQRIETLEKYIKQYPSGWKKRLELADLFFSIGHWDHAIVAYHHVLDRKPKSLEIWLKLGKIMQLSGVVDDAIQAYTHALSLCRLQATKHYISGLIECCRGQYINAVSSIQSATTLNPENSAYWVSLGLTYLNTESPIAALEAFQCILEHVPDDVVALSYSHDIFLVMGDLHAAQSMLEQAFSIAPDHLGIMERMIANYLRRRLVHGEAGKQTQQCIQKILKLAPDAPGVHALQARYYASRGMGQKGIKTMEEFTETHPTNPGSWYHYAQCLFHSGDSLAAARAIYKAYHLYPHDYEIYRALYEILPFADMRHDLKPFMREMVEKFPERWSAWAIAGRACIDYFQEPTQGLEFAAKGVELQPELADAWLQYGRALALTGHHGEAIATLKQGWEKLRGSPNPQAVPSAIWLGESYEHLGDSEACQTWWQIAADQANKIIPFHPALGHYWYGKAMHRLGDRPSAVAAYQMALEQQIQYPAYGEIKRLLDGESGNGVSSIN